MNNRFAIRTITVGINLESLYKTDKILHAIRFLKKAVLIFQEAGYSVQTIRIATNHLHEMSSSLTTSEVINRLKEIDALTHEDNIFFSVGELCKPNFHDAKFTLLAEEIISQTRNINFSVRISEFEKGIYFKSIKLAAEIISAIAHGSPGGEGNFRFAAAANCPPHIPFFPVAYHKGMPGFSLGIESPGILIEALKGDDWDQNKKNLQTALNKAFLPLENICMKISEDTGLVYYGIDTSTAPGLNSSIGEVIEKITHQAFGASSTLSACSFITDIIKNLYVKSCGYSGLMLPVLEDKILAQRVMEGMFTVQELLMYSAVSGTGLDVVPLPGNTTTGQLQRILMDVATLSVKYISKPMSARLFLIPGKEAGETVGFKNPYLTDSRVMKLY